MNRRGPVCALLAMVVASGCIASGPLPAPPSRAETGLDRTMAPSAAGSPAAGATLSGGSAASAGPTASALDPATARWVAIGAAGAGPGGGELLGFERGYVTIGTRDPYETPVAWFSSDGAGWTASSLANQVLNCPGWGGPGDEMVPDADASATATNGHQVVIVGAVQPHDAAQCANSGAYHPIAWVSDDGRTWRRSEPFDGGGVNGRATAVWAVPGGWQAVVDRSLWESADGLQWHSVPNLPGGAIVSAHAGPAPDGAVVVSALVGGEGDSRFQLFTSRDGQAWTSVDRAAGCETGATQIVAPAGSTLPAWVVLSDLRTCASVDLIHWSSTKLPIVVWRMAPTRFGVIAIGDTCVGAGNTCPNSEHRAYITTDGVTWSRLEHPDASFGRSLADGPAGVEMIGSGANGARGSHAWLLQP